MPRPLKLDPDRLFPADPATALARPGAYIEQVAGLPIVSPHGHTDPAWFATDAPWANADRAAAALPTIISTGCSTARACRSTALGVPSKAGRAGGSARGVAAVRRALSSLPRHAFAPVARPCLRRGVRLRRGARGGDRRSLLRSDRRGAGDAGLPAPRACSTASASNCSQPPRARTKISTTTPRSAGPAGAGRVDHHLSARRGGRSRA